MSVRGFIQKYERECLIVSLSIVVELIFFSVLVIHFGTPDEFTSMTGDASAYRTLAENLINHGSFSLSPFAPDVLDSFRSPGYPFFIAALHLLAGSWLGVILISCLIYALAPLLVYLIGKTIDERSAFIASIIFVFEPTRLFLSNSLLTDSLFTVLFLTFFYVLLKLLERLTYQRAVLAGLMIGLATLVRPISMFITFFSVGLLLILYARRNDYAKPIATSAIILVTFAAILFPWSMRNKIRFDSWQLSSIGSYNLVHYNIPEFLTYRDGEVSDQRLLAFYEESESLPYLEVLSLTRSDENSALAREILLDDPFGYARFHLVKTIPFFVTDGLRDIARTMNLSTERPPNFSTLITKGNYREVMNFLKENSIESYLFIVGFGFWLTVAILGLGGSLLVFIRRSDLRLRLGMLLFAIGYFGILTGPVSNARYRLPVSGLMIFLAVFVLTVAFSYFQRIRRHP